MAVISEMENGMCRLRVDSDMTIYTALDLKQQLLPYLNQASHLEVDCSGVMEMDSAGLQLLILLKRGAERRGCRLALTGHSAAVMDVIDTFNMGAFFGDPIVLQGQREV